jgi:hypothetical protein
MKIDIRTKDLEMYNKLKSLRFVDEVVLPKNKYATKIVNGLNRKQKSVETTNIGDKILIRRLKPLNLNIRRL